MTAVQQQKRITQVDHLPTVDRAKADRYYEKVHSEYVRRRFLTDAPAMVRYGWNRVVTEYAHGAFAEPARAWRFIVSEWRIDDRDPATTKTVVPPELLRQLSYDHLHFLYNMKSFDVHPTVPFSNLSGQLTTAKAIFTTALAAGHALAVKQLSAELNAFPGARLLVSNRVLRQVETLPIDDVGQRYGTGYYPEAEYAFIDEYYFDSEEVAAEFFSDIRVRSLLDLSSSSGYAVEECAQLDRRRALEVDVGSVEPDNTAS